MEIITTFIKKFLKFIIVILAVLATLSIMLSWMLSKELCFSNNMHKYLLGLNQDLEEQLSDVQTEKDLLYQAEIIINTTLDYDSLITSKKVFKSAFVNTINSHYCIDSNCQHLLLQNQFKLPHDSVVYSRYKIKNGYDRIHSQQILQLLLNTVLKDDSNIENGTIWFINNVINAQTKNEFESLQALLKEKFNANKTKFQEIHASSKRETVFKVIVLILLGFIILYLSKLLHTSTFIDDYQKITFDETKASPSTSEGQICISSIKEFYAAGNLKSEKSEYSNPPQEKDNYSHNVSSIKPILYDMDRYSTSHRYVGHFSLYFLIVVIIAISYFINFEFIPNQGQQIENNLKFGSSNYSLVVYYLGRAFIFGSFFSAGLFFIFKIVKGSYDQSIRYRKKMHSLVVFQTLLHKYSNHPPNHLSDLIRVYDSMTTSVDSAFNEKNIGHSSNSNSLLAKLKSGDSEKSISHSSENKF